LIIYYDSLPEAIWFKNLHKRLSDAKMSAFPARNLGIDSIDALLVYDRPDIILVDEKEPILVLERTVEVPSGHNVGQRFARLVAAAQLRIPAVYFGPYAAYKHGGATQGPRYMNLRLFKALKRLAQIEQSAVTVINWPVDDSYEIIQVPTVRDERVSSYLSIFFQLYDKYGLPSILSQIMESPFQYEQEREQETFREKSVLRPEQYDSPPDSVLIVPWRSIPDLAAEAPDNLTLDEVVLYKVGMTYVRSDPYTGMAMLYSYLYCGGLKNRTRNLVLHFPGISKKTWASAASKGDRKDIRLFRLAADGILFADGYLPKDGI
jgi:hypothetical protein